ncbi:flavodoxin family protein [Pseudoalteromonas pernae]|uniref:flavodoxin family protein n=1 Tax=Pseudoalteromonas pernae TaxID=3118054 RepID=UPI0032424D16
MSEHIIIFSSARRTGNTSIAAQTLAEKLKAEILFLDDYQINAYDYEVSEHKDDFTEVMGILLQFEHWVFASPVYWYNTTAQIKTFFDRITDYMDDETLQLQLRQLRNKRMSVLSTSNVLQGVDAFVAPFKLTAEYLGMTFKYHFHSLATSSGKISINNINVSNRLYGNFTGLIQKNKCPENT